MDLFSETDVWEAPELPETPNQRVFKKGKGHKWQEKEGKGMTRKGEGKGRQIQGNGKGMKEKET